MTILGAGICVVLFMVGDPNGAPWLVALIVGVAVLLLGTIIGIRVPRPGSGLGFWNALFGTRADRDQPIDYEPRPVKTSFGQTTGSQQPITVDEVRDIRELSTTTWVPSRLRRRRADDNDRLE